MAGPYDYTINIPQPPAQNFLQSLLGIQQLKQMQEQGALQQRQMAFQEQMQPLQIQAEQARIGQIGASTAAAQEALRQSKTIFDQEQALRKEAQAFNADVLEASKNPTALTRDRLQELSLRSLTVNPKAFDPLQKMLADHPRTGDVLANTASDVMLSVQAGKPGVALTSVNESLTAAENTLKDNPNDKDSAATIKLLQPVKTMLENGDEGSAAITASNFLYKVYPDKWDRASKALKGVAEISGESSKSALQAAQAKLAEADTRLKDLKASGSLDSEEKMKQENLMRENFQAQPLVRNFLIRQDNYDTIKNADKSPEGDRARITSFIKLHDPNSVVSITESNQITSTTPVAQYQNLIAKFNNDGILSDTVRASINSQAEKTIKSAESQFNSYKNNTAAIAKRYGINPKNIVEVFDRQPTEPTPAPAKNPINAPQLPISTGSLPVAPAGTNQLEVEMRRRGLIK
jgi:hypothetical protein